jgi:hypothetical protein
MGNHSAEPRFDSIVRPELERTNRAGRDAHKTR